MNEEEKEIFKRINSERETIEFFFKDLAESKKAIITPLIQNAAFMKVTLECLQEKINSEGVTEIYQNGANQCGVKQSATLQSYNSLIKNYASVIKTLSQLLPPEKQTNSILEYAQEKRKSIMRGERNFPDYEDWKSEKRSEE